MVLIPRSGRSPGGGHGNLLQYSCPENPMDTGACQPTVHRVAESQTQLKQLSTAHTAQCEKQIQNSIAFFKSTFVISYYLAKSDGLGRAAILCYTVPSGDGSCKTTSFLSLVF